MKHRAARPGARRGRAAPRAGCRRVLHGEARRGPTSSFDSWIPLLTIRKEAKGTLCFWSISGSARQARPSDHRHADKRRARLFLERPRLPPARPPFPGRSPLRALQPRRPAARSPPSPRGLAALHRRSARAASDEVPLRAREAPLGPRSAGPPALSRRPPAGSAPAPPARAFRARARRPARLRIALPAYLTAGASCWGGSRRGWTSLGAAARPRAARSWRAAAPAPPRPPPPDGRRAPPPARAGGARGRPRGARRRAAAPPVRPPAAAEPLPSGCEKRDASRWAGHLYERAVSHRKRFASPRPCPCRTHGDTDALPSRHARCRPPPRALEAAAAEKPAQHLRAERRADRAGKHCPPSGVELKERKSNPTRSFLWEEEVQNSCTQYFPADAWSLSHTTRAVPQLGFLGSCQNCRRSTFQHSACA